MINKLKVVLLVVSVLLSLNQVTAQTKDKKSEAIVKDLLVAMGGEDNYNATRYLQWDFANRKLSWDKWTGDVRLENPADNQVILLNINTLKGKVYENGDLVENETKVNSLLEKGKNWWINDAYWLVMPWKLQDPGTTLSFVKTDVLPNGVAADVLQLTFDGVGATPENKYWLYVSQEDHLIQQWAYYQNFNDAEPKFLKPWNNYQKLGGILLSFDRPNENVGPKNVIVNSALDPSVFTTL
jgi:hypothetical protein